MSGSFKPTNDGVIDTLPAPVPLSSGNVGLAAFNGANPNGQWQFFVRDNPGVNSEITGGWSLQITAKVKKKHQRRHRH